MAAPGVAEARLTMTAPFCAAVVETVGDEVGLTPPPPPAFPPPHPHIKAFASRIAASIVALAHIVFLLFQRKVKEPIRPGPYLTSLFHYPQYWAQTRARHATEFSKLLLLLLPSFSKHPQVLHSGSTMSAPGVLSVGCEPFPHHWNLSSQS